MFLDDRFFIQGVESLLTIIDEAWRIPRIGYDLVIGVCDHFRRAGFLDLVIHLVINNRSQVMRTRELELLDSYMSPDNRDYLMLTSSPKDFLKAVIG